MKTKRNAPPPGVATRARIYLLGEVWRGRVRWVVPDGPALLTPRQKRGMVELVDVTRSFLELVQSKWATVPPWDEENPPAAVECRTTLAGDEILLKAQFRARRRQVTDQARRPRKTVNRAESNARRAVLDGLLKIAKIFNGGVG